ncbi:MAG: T9SS type A sorting domain-containing protein [Bacteroidetes bacterium]|nr:T9SS type A sorting domain-containing protein [Bacteroidota bacterium]
MKHISKLIGALTLLVMLSINTIYLTAQIYPHGGVSNEKWVAGSAAQVRWNSELYSGTVRITLWDGERGENTTITDSVSASAGIYSFTLSSGLYAGSKYRVRVEQLGSPNTSRMSDSYFAIDPVPPIAMNPTSQNEDTRINSNVNLSSIESSSFASTHLVSQIKTQETALSSETEEDDFYNPNMICEQTVCKIKTFRIGRLYPQPATNGTLSIDAESSENATNVTAELYSITGQKLATLWEGSLKKGASTFTMTLQDVASGSYILYLKNNKGEIVDYNRVVVAEGQR